MFYLKIRPMLGFEPGDPSGLIWTHLDSSGLIWTHLDSPTIFVVETTPRFRTCSIFPQAEFENRMSGDSRFLRRENLFIKSGHIHKTRENLLLHKEAKKEVLFEFTLQLLIEESKRKFFAKTTLVIIVSAR
jgi:hypothetical protein